MVFQVQEETWLDNKEIQVTILCKRGYSEYIVSQTPELVFSSAPVYHSEVDVDFAV